MGRTESRKREGAHRSLPMGPFVTAMVSSSRHSGSEQHRGCVDRPVAIRRAHMIAAYAGLAPKIDPSAFVVNGATVIGDVVIGPESSIWFGAVVRGDIHPIRIGA